MKVKEENEKAGLKFSIQKTKIMTSSPITTWQTEGGKVEAVTDFLFLDSKITANGECSHEIKRHLLLGRKAMTNLDRVLKKQRYHFADKCPYSQSYGFSSSYVWMWELDVKKAEHKELMLLHSGAGEDSWESLGLQGDQTSQS